MGALNFFERTLAAVAPQYALQRAVARDRLTMFGYDAANPDGARGSSGGMAKNAASETPRMAQDRLKCMWDARDLERNMPVIRCALDRVAQYVCGSVRYQANTGDPRADSMYEDYMARWFEADADVTGRDNMRMLLELGFRSMLRDGDFGYQIVRVGPKLSLRAIESDRIGNPNTVSAHVSDDYVQGIWVDPMGRPTKYDIHKRDRKTAHYSKDVEVPANQFIFLNRPLRADEYRTVSWLAPILGQARDLYEMFSFERGAAKWAASIAGVITVTDPLYKGTGGSAGTFDGKTVTGEPTATVVGNRLLRLKPNENVATFNTGNRPSGAFMQYIESALRDIAMGLNVPYGFFNMAQFGGATVRLEAQQLDRTFKRYQEILVSRVLNRVVRAVLNNAIALRELPATENWASCRWQFGARLTADTGYDTDANLAQLSHGLKTAASIASDEGYDFEELTQAVLKEVAMVRDGAAAAGLPMEMVAPARFQGATDQLAAVSAALTPQPAPTVSDIGDGGVKNLVALLEAVANGTLPREEAVAFLVSVYEFSPEVAETVVPKVQPLAVAANNPPIPPKAKPESKGESASAPDESGDKE